MQDYMCYRFIAFLLPLSLVHGAGSPCDLNLDGQVNIVDVQRVTNQALGLSSCLAGDLDLNGTCNVVDVQRVINAALGGVCLSNNVVGKQWSIGYTGDAIAVADLQFEGLTHIVHWPLVVNDNGTLDTTRITPYSASLISAAHAAGVKVLLCIVQKSWLGPGHSDNFDNAIEGNLSLLVTNIMAVVDQYGYDGVDINWEPFNSASGGTPTQGTNFRALAAALRTALGSRLLTAAIYGSVPYYGAEATWIYFDRLNAMTYDMQWIGNGKISHNNHLFNTGCSGCSSIVFDSSFYLSAGLPPERLGIGIAFYGRRWNGGVLASNPSLGISHPLEVWSDGNPPTGGDEVFYPDILALSDDAGVSVIYDSAAEAPYLSHPGTPSTAWSLSYSDPQSITAIIAWVKSQGLGGWIIWGLWADFVDGAANEHPLLDAVAAAQGVP